MIGWALRRLFRGLRLVLSLPLRLPSLLLAPFDRPDLLVVRLHGDVHEVRPRGLRRWLAARKERLSLPEALLALEELETARHPRGVLLILDQAELGLAAAEELRAALGRVRAAGKKVLAWVDPTTGPALLAASAAERVLALPESSLEWLGLRLRAMFLKDLLEQVGVGVQVEKRGKYKTAANPLFEQGLTPPHREMLGELGNDLQAQMVEPIARARGLEPAALVSLLGEAPVSHRRALEAKLLDGLAYRDEVEKQAGELLGMKPDDEPDTASPADLLARRARRRRVEDALRDRGRVAVLSLKGPIRSGEEGAGIPAAAAIEAMDKLRQERRVRAVVLHIDSPGGSAFASDELWRAATRLAEEKPLVASMGRVAASGGYYLAVAAHTIFAHPATLTGSIGVISGKLHLAPLLKKAGVAVETIELAPRAGMLEPDRPLTDDEFAALSREVERIYRVFLERVAAGRKKTVAEVEPLAGGRVYTGRRAKELGLVDRLGGLEAAVIEAAARAGLGPEPEVVTRALPKKGMAGLVGLGAEVLPLPLADVAEAWMLAREPVLAWCPLRV